jgi:hypothetical protein
MDLCQIAIKFLSSTCPLCLSLCKFLTKSKITLIQHPSSSPDLAPCDISFSKLKVVLKVRRFNNVLMIQAMHLLSFKQCTSWNVLNGTLSTGFIMLSPKQITLKGTTFIRSKELLLWRNKFSPGDTWWHHIHMVLIHYINIRCYCTKCSVGFIYSVQYSHNEVLSYIHKEFVSCRTAVSVWNKLPSGALPAISSMGIVITWRSHRSWGRESPKR